MRMRRGGGSITICPCRWCAWILLFLALVPGIGRSEETPDVLTTLSMDNPPASSDEPGMITTPRPEVASGELAPESQDLPRPPSYGEPWTWQTLPNGLIYHSYLAGTKEPRLAAEWVHDKHQGYIWDSTLGGRVGIFRYGTEDSRRPDGWQLDLEGAAFPRMNMDESLDLMATDYRIGLPLTYGAGAYQAKFAAYHLCSHLGDELMQRHPDIERINYSRNTLVWGNSYFWTEDIRLYAETGWAFYADGGSKPWEFQFGIDYSPARPTGRRPVPFVAINGNLREDVGFGGNLTVQTGYQWRGESNHLFRAGMHYYTGKSDQYEFFRNYEDKIGLGLWYDF